MKAYNGHRSWNHWNATLWLSNDLAVDSLISQHVNKGYTNEDLIEMLYIMIGNSKTLDGAVINRLAIKNFVNSYVLD